MAAGQNPFGDRYTVRVTGSLLLTDLRILFLPKRVDAPPWLQLPILSYTHDPQVSQLLSEFLLLLFSFAPHPTCMCV